MEREFGYTLSMKLEMKVCETKNKTLASGDKSMRIILETVYPGDIVELSAMLAEKIFVNVELKPSLTS